MFEVGQRVRCTYRYRGIDWSNNRVEIDTLSKLARVKRLLSDVNLTVTWTDPDLEQYFQRAYSLANGGHWSINHWEPAAKPLDAGRPVRFRSENLGPVMAFESLEDPARPFAARVCGRRLTFDPEGFFYPDIEQPIDLVNI